MTVFCKVGFHGGSGGNHTGITDYLRRLDEARIPFCLKSVNNVGLVVEAANFARASGVPHNIVIRWSNPGKPPGPEVPDYRKSPDEAAKEHWALVKQSISLAPEFDEFKDLVWIESFNEPRTEPDPGDPNFENMHPSEWLGWFAHHVGKLSVADGYRWAAFGMNAGTPEIEDWRRPGMVQYLQDCANNPEMLAVALHEYTFTLDEPMTAKYPYLMGRFQWLYQVCDELGIARPTTLITEGGWTYNSMPPNDRAMEDVRWWSELIAPYPTLLGAYLWTLEGPSKLPNKLQKFIKPLTEYALQARFADTTPVEPPKPPSEPPSPEKREEPPETSERKARGVPRVQFERTYVLLPPKADKEWAKAVIDATWDKNKYTVGSSPDDAGVGDLEFRRVIAINPQEWGSGEDGTGLRGFFEKYYPGVRYEPVEAASPSILRAQLSK